MWPCLLADGEQPPHVCYLLSASWCWGSCPWTTRLNLLTGEMWTSSPQPLIATCLGSQIPYIVKQCRLFFLGVRWWTRHYSFDPLTAGIPLQVAFFHVAQAWYVCPCVVSRQVCGLNVSNALIQVPQGDGFSYWAQVDAISVATELGMPNLMHVSLRSIQVFASSNPTFLNCLRLISLFRKVS